MLLLVLVGSGDAVKFNVPLGETVSDVLLVPESDPVTEELLVVVTEVEMLTDDELVSVSLNDIVVE